MSQRIIAIFLLATTLMAGEGVEKLHAAWGEARSQFGLRLAKEFAAARAPVLDAVRKAAAQRQPAAGGAIEPEVQAMVLLTAIGPCQGMPGEQPWPEPPHGLGNAIVTAWKAMRTRTAQAQEGYLADWTAGSAKFREMLEAERQALYTAGERDAAQALNLRIKAAEQATAAGDFTAHGEVLRLSVPTIPAAQAGQIAAAVAKLSPLAWAALPGAPLDVRNEPTRRHDTGLACVAGDRLVIVPRPRAIWYVQETKPHDWRGFPTDLLGLPTSEKAHPHAILTWMINATPVPLADGVAIAAQANGNLVFAPSGGGSGNRGTLQVKILRVK